jgi:hypothetical protein
MLEGMTMTFPWERLISGGNCMSWNKKIKEKKGRKRNKTLMMKYRR